MNEEPNVSPELTAKVQAAIKELNYTPNESARMLRRGKTGTIAVVIRDIGDPFFASLGRAVELYLGLGSPPPAVTIPAACSRRPRLSPTAAPTAAVW